MRINFILLVATLAILYSQAYATKVVRPAMTKGQLTGQMTFYEEDQLFSREKRQSGRRRPNGRRPRPPPPTQAATTAAATTAAATTAAPTTTTTTTTTTTSGPEVCGAEMYRSADGSCNNAANPTWGQVDSSFLRMLEPQYNEDVVNGQVVYGPKQFSEVNGAELPNVREISRFVHDPDDRPERRPVMSMQWGQFIDHDITSTPINPTDKTCCYDGIIASGVSQHEDVSVNGPCFPILIGDRDPHFNTEASRCMENKRSFQVTENGKPEQINMITPFIDGSMIYGVSDEEMKSLRSDARGRGRLLEVDNNLPAADSNNVCVIDEGRENEDYCLKAGDRRVNVYPGLGALHTVFMRMHNLIADGLAAQHAETDWNDEKVFQEARRIVGALLQKITYSEWLPSILGEGLAEDYRLLSGDYAYEPTTNPTLFNVFSTAAFRFGHSMITDTLTIDDLQFESIDLFNNPRYVLHSLDSLLEGLLEDVSQRVDRWYSTGMTNHMFETSPRNGFDIVALNIQRGRDHGLPSYNDWRASCGFTPLANLAALGRDERPYSRVYSNVDDIDLYSGALRELPVTEGIVGETYACLIGRQFENLKYGDRFWYENLEGANAFNQDQIGQINSQSLATVLCQTTNLASVQDNAFMNVDDRRNPAVDCSTVQPIDYSLF